MIIPAARCQFSGCRRTPHYMALPPFGAGGPANYCAWCLADRLVAGALAGCEITRYDGRAVAVADVVAWYNRSRAG